jgi:hypothetical protein
VNGAGRLISKCRHVVIALRVSIGFADALDASPPAQLFRLVVGMGAILTVVFAWRYWMA